MEGGAWSLCCGGCGLHDSLVSLLWFTRGNANSHKSLDLPPPQQCNPIRRGHQPVGPIMSGLALRCSNLRLWSSHQASPSSPHFLALPTRLASRFPPALVSSRAPLSPCPFSPSLVSASLFLSWCLLCVSLLGLHHWIPGAPISSETRPRLQHLLDTPSRPLTCAMGGPRQFQDVKVPRPQSKSDWLDCLDFLPSVPMCLAETKMPW